jgi:hypothetical protein
VALDTGRLKFHSLIILLLGLLPQPDQARATDGPEVPSAPLAVDAAGTLATATPISATATAIVNFAELARLEALGLAGAPPIRTWMPPEYPSPAEPFALPAPPGPIAIAPLLPCVASPGPSVSYMGLDDIPMVDSLHIVIPPDIGGAPTP